MELEPDSDPVDPLVHLEGEARAPRRTPEQAGLQLLAIPFKPTHAEYVYLQGRKILADQMEFLLAHFPRNSQLRQRVESGQELLT